MKIRFWIYIFLFVIIFSTRLYKFDNPVADWHSWRQADTAAVARVFEDNGMDIFHPRYYDLSNIQSGKDNPEGFRMVEMPLYQMLGVGLHKIIPYFTIEQALRLVSIFSSFFSAVLIFEIGFLTQSIWIGFMSAFIFSVLPFSVYYGRTILPENTAVCCALFGLYLLLLLAENDSKSGVKLRSVFILGAGISSSLALLIKPTAAFILLPGIFTYFIKTRGKKGWILNMFIFSTVAIFPFWWWRSWINQFPEGIPVSLWLFNEGNIRFKGAWFYWLFGERIGRLIMGYWGTTFLTYGILIPAAKKNIWFIRFLALAVIAYFVVFARGNVQHDYYQIVILPMVSIITGHGIISLFNRKSLSESIFSTIIIVFVGLLGLAFSWYTIRTYYWINHPEIVEAGIAADKLLPKDAKVIAPYNGDTTFLYHIRRFGWPLGFDIGKKITMGATHYISVADQTTDMEIVDLSTRFELVTRTDKYIIIDLKQPK